MIVVELKVAPPAVCHGKRPRQEGAISPRCCISMSYGAGEHARLTSRAPPNQPIVGTTRRSPHGLDPVSLSMTEAASRTGPFGIEYFS